jgi:aminoglycoside phosphotransferase family enzyme
LPSFIDFLIHPAAYPHVTGEITLRQTHISYVFLAGDYVYKIKKPVDFGFLDFTTLAKRKYYCAEELRLNRRLCPDIYLAVVPIKRLGNRFVVGGELGETVEFAVKMVRLPEERMMNNIMAAGNLRSAMVARIVDILVPFYRGADSGPEISQAGSPAAVGENFRENFRQTASYIGCAALGQSQFAAIRSYMEEFLLGRTEILRQRQEEGRIRDGHGDLHSANICLGDRVYIFDCIEFNPRLRYCDVASDVAFLAMDLDFHGLTGLAAGFIDRFVDESGDGSLRQVLNLYKCYRAYVRGKIGLFTAHAPEVDESTRAAGLDQAGRYFKLAERYAGEQ